MQHQHGYAASASTCSMGMDMLHGYAAWAWTHITGIDMHHGHGHAAWIQTCSMDITSQQNLVEILLTGPPHTVLHPYPPLPPSMYRI
jgi:hypothetical protein